MKGEAATDFYELALYRNVRLARAEARTAAAIIHGVEHVNITPFRN
jgi:hypothetical protein